jgi:hypothetical protein
MFVISLMLLVGCSGNGNDTPPVVTPDETLAVGIDGQTLEDLIENATRPLDQQPTSASFTGLVPSASHTEEPTPGDLFDWLAISRTGGRGQPEYHIQIYPDGRLIINGEEGQLPEHEINALQARFDEIKVYAIENNQQIWASNPEVFRYKFEIFMDTYNTRLEGENAYVPLEVREIIGFVIDEYPRYID